jgi:uncharacterized DUF497 family protein
MKRFLERGWLDDFIASPIEQHYRCPLPSTGWYGFSASCFGSGPVDTKWYNSNAGGRGMRIHRIFWDLDDDPEGNVQHVAEHGISVEEVEDVLYAAQEVVASESSGRPITFGETSTGKYIAVVFDVVEDDPLAVYPVTAYETEP